MIRTLVRIRNFNSFESTIYNGNKEV